MTPEERSALQVVEHLLRGHHCPACGREWITGASVGVLMHKCRPAPGPRRRISLDALLDGDPRDTDRRAWAETQLGGAVSDAVEREYGPEATLRILTREEE